MTDLKIGVSAEVSGVESALAKVQQAAEKINKTLSSGEVGINIKDAESTLAEMAADAAKLGKLFDSVKDKGEILGALDFDEIKEALQSATDAGSSLEAVLKAVGKSSGASAAVKNTRQMAENLEKAARAQQVVSREALRNRHFEKMLADKTPGMSRLHGMTHDEFQGGGWRKLDANEKVAWRKKLGIDRNVEESIGGPNGGLREKLKSYAMQMAASGHGGRTAGALGGIAGGMMGGGDGGLWGAVGGGGGSLLGAGAGAMVGGVPGAIVGSIVGGFASKALGGLGNVIDQAIQRSVSEGADLSALRQSVGSARIDFDDLRNSVRYFSDGLGVTYNEAAKLAQQFTQTAGAVKDEKDIARSTADAIGFARGAGSDKNQAVQFFGAMRQYGLSQNDKDGRKLGLQISEAIARGGMSAKTGEALSAIQNYVQSQTQRSMSSADGAGFAAMMANLASSGVPGLNGSPGNAAAIMSRINDALGHGGNFGEASKNALLAGYMNHFGPGFTAFDARLIDDHGAFEDLGNAFDPMIQLAESRGDRAKADQLRAYAARGKGKSKFDIAMRMLNQDHGGNIDQYALSGGNLFGLNMSQFARMSKLWSDTGGMPDLGSRLKQAGLDETKMSTSQQMSLALLAYGKKEDLDKQAAMLRARTGAKALSSQDAAELNKPSDNIEEYRNRILKLSSKYDTTGDQGRDMLDNQVKMSNATQLLADHLIPLTKSIQEGIASLVMHFAPNSDFANKKKMGDEAAKNISAILSDPEGAAKKKAEHEKKAEKARIAAEAAEASGNSGMADVYRRAQASEAANASKYDLSAMQSKKDAADAYLGNSSGVASSGVDAPSGNAPSSAQKPSAAGAVKGKQPINERNNNPGNIIDSPFAREMGATGENGGFAVFANKAAGSEAMRELLRRYGKQGRNTPFAIASKWAPKGHGNNDPEAYAKHIARRLGVKDIHDKLDMDDDAVIDKIGSAKAAMEGSESAYESKIPQDARRSSPSGNIKISTSGELMIVDKDRKPTGQTVPLAFNVSEPAWAGQWL